MRNVTVIMLIALAASCGPSQGKEPKGDEAQRYADEICGAIETCGCYDHFASSDACEMEYAQRFKALDDKMELDVDCFESVIDGDEDLAECVVESPSEWSCTVLHGRKEMGDPCSAHNLEVPPFIVNECAGDLACLDGVCAIVGSSGPELAVGDACFAEQPMSCHAEGLYCAEDATCRVDRFPGESCTSAFACARVDDTTSYCQGLSEGAGTCAAASLVGDACDPRDWFACGVGWCDPSEGTCTETAPNICRMTDFPNARPSAP